jgi:hypothetical protein
MLSSFGDLVALSPHCYTRPILLQSTADNQNERGKVRGGEPLVIKTGRHAIISTIKQVRVRVRVRVRVSVDFSFN